MRYGCQPTSSRRALPSHPNLLETHYTFGGVPSRIDVVRVPLSGIVKQEFPNSIGSVMQFGTTWSDSTGELYIANARLNANWQTT
jgi:hypothetical protein